MPGVGTYSLRNSEMEISTSLRNSHMMSTQSCSFSKAKRLDPNKKSIVRADQSGIFEVDQIGHSTAGPGAYYIPSRVAEVPDYVIKKNR